MQSSPKSLQIDAHYGVPRGCNLTIEHFPIDMFHSHLFLRSFNSNIKKKRQEKLEGMHRDGGMRREGQE